MDWVGAVLGPGADTEDVITEEKPATPTCSLSVETTAPAAPESEVHNVQQDSSIEKVEPGLAVGGEPPLKEISIGSATPSITELVVGEDHPMNETSTEPATSIVAEAGHIVDEETPMNETSTEPATSIVADSGLILGEETSSNETTTEPITPTVAEPIVAEDSSMNETTTEPVSSIVAEPIAGEDSSMNENSTELQESSPTEKVEPGLVVGEETPRTEASTEAVTPLIKVESHPVIGSNVLSVQKMEMEQISDDEDESQPAAKPGTEPVKTEATPNPTETTTEEKAYASDFDFGSDSDSDSSSDEEVVPRLSREEREKRLVAMDESGGDMEEVALAERLRTKNEVAALPVVEPLPEKIPEQTKVYPIGRLQNRVGELLIIETPVGTESENVLDADSIVVFADRTPMGRIFETFGPVTRPLYSIRFNSTEEVDQLLEKAPFGTEVFAAAGLDKVIITRQLQNMKGSDASNIYDEEVAEAEMEFSDDEQETEHKRRLKMKRKQGHEPSTERDNAQRSITEPLFSSGPRGDQSQSPYWGSGDHHQSSSYRGNREHSQGSYRGNGERSQGSYRGNSGARRDDSRRQQQSFSSHSGPSNAGHSSNYPQQQQAAYSGGYNQGHHQNGFANSSQPSAATNGQGMPNMGVPMMDMNQMMNMWQGMLQQQQIMFQQQQQQQQQQYWDSGTNSGSQGGYPQERPPTKD